MLPTSRPTSPTATPRPPDSYCRWCTRSEETGGRPAGRGSPAGAERDRPRSRPSAARRAGRRRRRHGDNRGYFSGGRCGSHAPSVDARRKRTESTAAVAARSIYPMSRPIQWPGRKTVAWMRPLVCSPPMIPSPPGWSNCVTSPGCQSKMRVRRSACPAPPPTVTGRMLGPGWSARRHLRAESG